MSSRSTSEAAGFAVHRLPFPVEDVAEVNRLFSEWKESRDKRSEEIIQLWIYSYSKKYFLVKFVQEGSNNLADADELAGRAFYKISRKLHTVRKPGHFASWVSVICRRMYINHLRSRTTTVSLDHVELPAPEEISLHPDGSCDPLVLYRALEQAITRLPPYLREVAELRFLEGMNSNEISEHVGRPEPTVRAYISKAAFHFQADDDLKRFVLPKDG